MVGKNCCKALFGVDGKLSLHLAIWHINILKNSPLKKQNQAKSFEEVEKTAVRPEIWEIRHQELSIWNSEELFNHKSQSYLVWC